jgi:hypothetical protein
MLLQHARCLISPAASRSSGSCPRCAPLALVSRCHVLNPALLHRSIGIAAAQALAGPAASIDALMSIASCCSINNAEARAILEDVERAVSGWRALGKALSMTARELDQFADAFEHAERAAAQKIARSRP